MTRRSPCLALLLAASAAAAAPPPPAPPATPAIDQPHAYYYSEMYLPQLTAGPSSLAWSPDSRELVYSMAGSLWRQRIDATLAVQLTDDADYDYQPDWSPDGRFIVYTSAAAGGSSELWLLDVPSGRTSQLTHDGAVDLEPRWSPDGQQLVYVSTVYHRHFHVFVADFRDGRLSGARRLTGETTSAVPRYYYGPTDVEINPSWTRDGRAVLYVSNHGHLHGTGGFWRLPLEPNAPAMELHYEETNWQARPEMSPDGRRMVYSSYLGRQWLQLWLLPADGGDAFQLTFGDWDDTGPRWSPDGRQLAFISNRGGGTGIELLAVPGGPARALELGQRQRLRPAGNVHLVVRDERGLPTPARAVVTDAAGRAQAPPGAWLHYALFDRDEHPFDARYFHTSGDETIEVPAGRVSVEVMKGPERTPQRRSIEVAAGATTEVAFGVPANPWLTTPGERWVSADVHVHMNYGGHYRNTPAHLVFQAQAEDVNIIESLIVNKDQRFPDIVYSGRGVDLASLPDTLVVHGQEFHTSYWGHLGVLAIRGGVLLPGYAGYLNTAAASLFPTNADVADLGHAQGAVVGYVHPFEEEPQPFTHPAHTDADELPVDVALGKVDYMEIVSFADHEATAGVWYRLLNLGFRIPAAAGTDAMANYAILRGPVGLNRVYAAVSDGPIDHDEWLKALRAGRTFATNGPLLNFSLGGQRIGATVQLEQARKVAFSAQLRSIVPLDHAQVVCDGHIAAELPLRGGRTALTASGSVPLDHSGWCVLRAFTAHAEYPILDNFIYATTSPIYVSLRGAAPRSPEDARYFVAWIDRLLSTTDAWPEWNSAAEKAAVLQQLKDARAVYERLE